MQKLLLLWLLAATLAHAGPLHFPKASQEINAPADVTSVIADFEFSNTSSKPVQIIKSDPGCSCVAVEISNGKLRYAPGESGLIRAKFDMTNFSGSVDKAIALWLDKDPENAPSTFLKLRVNIPVLVALEPKTLKWNLGTPATPQTIEINIAEGHTIQINQVTSSSSDFTHELKTLTPGKHFQLIITPTKTTTPGIAIFRLETDSSIPKHKTQQAFAVLRKPSPAEAAAAATP